MIKLSESLYNKLPAVYRNEDGKIDPNPYPLKRFLQVLGGGYDFLEDKIDKFGSIVDIDKCPPEYLPLIAHLLGIEFPYSMDADTQRRYIKVIPILNRLKGTPASFEYLARETFGSSAVIDSFKTQYVAGMTPEEWRKFHVRVELDGETTYLANKEENFKKFAELLRPANSILVTDLALFYLDKWNNRANIEYTPDKFIDTTTETYLKSVLLDTILAEIMTILDSDSYVKTKTDTLIDFPKTSDEETFSKGQDIFDSLQLTLLNPDTETYNLSHTSEGTTRFSIAPNGISNLTGTTKLTTSFKTVNYAPLNYTLSH